MLKLFSRAMEVGHHGSNGEIGGFGDLLVAEVLHGSQQEAGSLFLVELIQRSWDLFVTVLEPLLDVLVLSGAIGGLKLHFFTEILQVDDVFVLFFIETEAFEGEDFVHPSAKIAAFFEM